MRVLVAAGMLALVTSSAQAQSGRQLDDWEKKKFEAERTKNIEAVIAIVDDISNEKVYELNEVLSLETRFGVKSLFWCAEHIPANEALAAKVT